MKMILFIMILRARLSAPQALNPQLQTLIWGAPGACLAEAGRVFGRVRASTGFSFGVFSLKSCGVNPLKVLKTGIFWGCSGRVVDPLRQNCDRSFLPGS